MTHIARPPALARLAAVLVALAAVLGTQCTLLGARPVPCRTDFGDDDCPSSQRCDHGECVARGGAGEGEGEGEGEGVGEGEGEGEGAPACVGLQVNELSDQGVAGACVASGTAGCSLREAIATVLGGADDTVCLPPGSNLLDDEIDVPGGVTVTVSGAGATSVVDGGAAHRIFRVGANASLALADMTLTRGFADFEGGGAVLVDAGAASLTRVRFEDNTITRQAGSGSSNDVFGAALLVDSGGAADVSECVFDGNRLDVLADAGNASGGAIAVRGGARLAVDLTSFEGNGSGAFGGALHTHVDGSFVTVQRSLFRSNTSDSAGGAIDVADGFGGALAVTNCTFTGNTSNDGAAGVVWNDATVESVTLQYCTFDNDTPADIAASRTNGGAHVFASISDSSLFSNGVTGAIVSDGGNVIGNAGDFLESGDDLLVDPGLVPEGPLDHGGPTLTIALQGGSPARAIGGTCPDTDQRGFARPADGCDAGAFDTQAVPP